MEVNIGNRIFNISFNDLTTCAQIKLYNSAPKLFEEEAAKSKDYRIQKLIAENEKTNPAVLLKMIEMHNLKSEVVTEILNNPNFKKTEEVMERLIENEGRLAVAENTETSSNILNKILQNEVLKKYKDCYQSAYSISHNPNFKMDDETRNLLLTRRTKHLIYFKLAVNDEGTSSKILNKIFRKEIKERKAGYKRIVYIILNSPNFEMDSESNEIWKDHNYKKYLDQK